MTGIEFALACVGGVLGAMLERYAYRAIRRAVTRKRRRNGPEPDGAERWLAHPEER